MIHKLFNFTKLFKILKSLKISTLKKKVPPLFSMSQNIDFWNKLQFFL